MCKKAVALCLLTALLTSLAPVSAQTVDELSAEIKQVREQLAEMEKKLEELQASQAQSRPAQENLISLSATLGRVKDAVEEPEGAIQTTIADVGKLKKIKVSGYLQARYESYENPVGVYDLANNKAPDNRAYMRRGRFKISAQPTDYSVGVVQLDISGFDRTKVESKDLYLELHPWGVGVPAPFFVRFGQQNWPFGYAIERSSSAREVPERPKVFAGTTVALPNTPSFNGLFPGERDKGLCLVSPDLNKLEWALGLFNGTGTKSGTFGSTFLDSSGKFEDNNDAKVLCGRVRYPFGTLNVGGSIYIGSQAVMPVSNAPVATTVDQTRYGLDFQYYMESMSIKGEYVTGREPYYSNTTTTPNGKSGTFRDVSGWYLVGVKNFGPKWQLVAQYDELNDRAMASTYGKLKTWNLGVIRFLDENTKLKLFYEINDEEKNPVRNNGLRLEALTIF